MNEQENTQGSEHAASSEVLGDELSPGKIPLLKRFEEVWAAYAPLLRPCMMLFVFLLLFGCCITNSRP